MYPVLKIMHMLNFLDTFSMGITEWDIDEIKYFTDFQISRGTLEDFAVN